MVAKGNGLATNDNGAEEPRADIVVKTDWGTVNSWADVLAMFPEGLDTSTEVFGDGSELIEDKSLLIDKPFAVLEFRVVTDKDTLRDYVNVLVMLRDGNHKVRFNDGSTGVMAQCLEYERRTGRNGGILCAKGLRVSEYVKDMPDGTKQPAKTYYFN